MIFAALEMVGFATLLLAIWVLYRAAAARPDDPFFLIAARTALGGWLVFVAVRYFDPANLWDNRAEIVRTGLIVAALLGVVLGYRWLLGRAKARAGDPE